MPVKKKTTKIKKTTKASSEEKEKATKTDTGKRKKVKVTTKVTVKKTAKKTKAATKKKAPARKTTAKKTVAKKTATATRGKKKTVKKKAVKKIGATSTKAKKKITKVEKKDEKEVPEIKDQKEEKTEEPVITMKEMEKIQSDREKVLAEEKKENNKDEVKEVKEQKDHAKEEDSLEEDASTNFLESDKQKEVVVKNTSEDTSTHSINSGQASSPQSGGQAAQDKVSVKNDDKMDELVLKGDDVKNVLALKKEEEENIPDKEEEKEHIEKIEEAIVDNLGASRSVGMYRKIALSFIVLTVILLAVIFYFSFTRVTITLIPNQERVSNNLIFDIYDSENADSVSSVGIPGIVREITIEDTKEYPATGSNVIGKEVVGKVNIINNYTKNQPLVATTRLLSQDGKLFRLKETVNVPVGGLKDIEVYADEAKPEMAVGPTTFTIPGLWAGLQDKIYAKNTNDIVYRQKVKKYIVESDVDKGEMDLKEQLLTSVKSKVNDIYKDYEQVIFKIDEQSIKSEVDGEIEEERDTLTIDMGAKVMVIAFDDETASKLAKNKFVSALPDNKELITFDDNNIIYSLNNYNSTESIASVNATFEGKVTLKGDSNIIDVEKILGLNESQLKTYLNDKPEIAGFEIEFYPKFIKKVPKLVDKIDIKIKK